MTAAGDGGVPRRGSLRVLGFGTYDRRRHPRIGIVLNGLGDNGDQVVEANAPLGFTTGERVQMLQRPWLAYRLAGRMARRWWTITVGALRARRGGPFDAVVVGYLGHFDVVLARLLFPRTTVILDMLVFAADTARDRGLGGGLTLPLLSAIDGLAVRCADLVMVDTVEHEELISPGQRHKSVVVAVGADDDWFRAGSAGPRSWLGGPLRVVYFGLFTPLHGAPVVGRALALLAGRDDIEVTMIGTGQDLEETRAAAAGNQAVKWREWVAPEVLPSTVAAHDVCLGIFSGAAKALRVVPNKVYQGAAAGCAIVTSATAPQQRAFGDAAVFVPPGDASALAGALRRLASDREYLSSLRREARRRGERFTARLVVGGLRDRLGAGGGDAAGVVAT